MGKDRQPARIEDHVDRGLRPEPFATDIARLTVADDPTEGVLDAGRETRGDQGTRDRRSAEGVVITGLEPLDLRVDRHTDLTEQGDRAIETGPTRISLGAEDALERRVRGIHPEPEDVQLAFPQSEVARDERVDLDRRDQRHD